MTVRRIGAALALGLGLGAAAAPALAREINTEASVQYQVISEDEELMTAADAASRQALSDGRVRMDTVFVYAKPKGDAAYVYQFASMEFDCTGGRGWRVYSRSSAAEDRVIVGRSEGYGDWKPLAEGTIGGRMAVYACLGQAQGMMSYIGLLQELRTGYVLRNRDRGVQ